MREVTPGALSGSLRKTSPAPFSSSSLFKRASCGWTQEDISMSQEMIRRLTSICLIAVVATVAFASRRDSQSIAFGAVDDRGTTIELVIGSERVPNVEVSRSL